MKICPNCGAENEENVQICILCEYEFEVPAETQQVSEPVYQEPVQPVYAAQTAYPVDNAKGNSKALPVALGVVFGLVAAAALFFGLNYFDSQKKAPDAPVADVVAETTVEATEATEAETTADTVAETTAEAVTQAQTEAVTEAVTKAAKTPQQAVPVSDTYTGYTATNNEELHSVYSQIVSSFPNFTLPASGTLYDFNGDGLDEMIVTDTSTFSYLTFKVYKCKGGKVYYSNLGNYNSLGVSLYSVYNPNGSNYLYFRNDYAYMSKQGYIDIDTNNELDISIDYQYNNGPYIANWSITNNGTILSNGSESANSFPDQVPICHESLMSSLPSCGFNIVENSAYTSIELLYPDDLKKALGGDNTASYPDTSDFAALGKIVTEKDPLNMRDMPDTNGEIIFRIPKGDYVGIYSETGNWYYVKYSKDANSPFYYGYVSKDYVQITEVIRGF